jgi:hypothetical protein
MTDVLGCLGVARVVNAAGSVTRLGASPIAAEVTAAMAAAAHSSVDIAFRDVQRSRIHAGFRNQDGDRRGASSSLVISVRLVMSGRAISEDSDCSRANSPMRAKYATQTSAVTPPGLDGRAKMRVTWSW